MNRRPLVVDQGSLEQLQASDDLDIPLQARVDDLERRYRLLLADYVSRFGFVAALGGENNIALNQG